MKKYPHCKAILLSMRIFFFKATCITAEPFFLVPPKSRKQPNYMKDKKACNPLRNAITAPPALLIFPLNNLPTSGTFIRFFHFMYLPFFTIYISPSTSSMAPCLLPRADPEWPSPARYPYTARIPCANRTSTAPDLQDAPSYPAPIPFHPP